MFSGIVEQVAQVDSFAESGYPRRLRVKISAKLSNIQIGESIAIEGVCLSVVAHGNNTLEFDVIQETARRSTLGTLAAGDRVNLERSLQIGDRVSGHFVFGHVDCTTRLLRREADGESQRLCFSLEPNLHGMLAPKGSISLAGVSLTIGEVSAENFSVYIIPHTAAHSTLGDLQVGRAVNCEIDMLMRYVHAQLRSGRKFGELGGAIEV